MPDMNVFKKLRTLLGLDQTKIIRFAQQSGKTSYVARVPIPAGAVVTDIQVRNTVLWNGASATLKIGDSFDDDGYFTGVNLMATDLVVGEVLAASSSTNWGGKNGVYLVSATGRFGGVQAGNSGNYYGVKDYILITITVGTPGTYTVGRTQVTVSYTLGEDLTNTITVS